MYNFTGIKNISAFKYALYIDGYLIDSCSYDDYGKISEWEEELESYEWDSIAQEVYNEECNKYD